MHASRLHWSTKHIHKIHSPEFIIEIQKSQRVAPPLHIHAKGTHVVEERQNQK